MGCKNSVQLPSSKKTGRRWTVVEQPTERANRSSRSRASEETPTQRVHEPSVKGLPRARAEHAPARAGVAVQQPTVCLEKQVGVVGGSAVDLRRSARDLPLEVEFRLQEACLLTEVELVWDQSVPFAVRFEVCVDDIPVAVQWSQAQERRIAGQASDALRCRIQLDEPQEHAQSCVLCVFTNDHLSNRGALSSNDVCHLAQDRVDPADQPLDEDWIHIAQIIPRGLPSGSRPPRRRLLRPPGYWYVEGTPHRRVEIAAAGVDVFQRLLDSTWKGQATRDRSGALP